MKIKLGRENVAVVLCFLMVFLSEAMMNFMPTVATRLKICALLLLCTFSFFRLNFNRNLVFLTSLFVIDLVVNFFVSFNYQAAAEEFVRFMFLPAVLFFGYSYRKKIDLFINLIIVGALVSDLFQAVNYLCLLTSWMEPLIPLRIKGGGFAINAGLFDVSNATVNLSAFILVYAFREIRYRKFLIAFFFAATLLTLSYKTIPFLLVPMLLFSRKKLSFGIIRNTIFVTALLFVLALLFSSYLGHMYDLLLKKIDFYIVTGDSARYESYRVMVEFLSKFNLLGEGLGAFGGPASVAYESPTYAQYGFDWYFTIGMNTTDTFYPHLFVELSWIGGLLYLVMLCLPVMQTRSIPAIKINLIILAALMFESLFSFGLANLLELMSTVLLFYGINWKYEKDTADQQRVSVEG